MEVRFFGRRVSIPTAKILGGMALLFVVVALFRFGYEIYRQYRGIKAGEKNPFLERRLDASFSRLVANNSVTESDLERLESIDAPRAGAKDAKLTIVEFLDFDCPFCRASHAPFREIMERYKDRVTFIVRDFPIEELHPRAFAAAIAARCAHAQGKYWPYHDKLFVAFEKREDADFLRFATELGLDEAKFRTCYDDRTPLSKIQADQSDGLRVGVSGTPAFFFNGVRIQGGLDAEQLEFLIERFLKETN